MPRRFDPALLPKAPNLTFEQALWAMGLRFIAGIDEAGRGSLAGPVAAAAVVYPPDLDSIPLLNGVRDSKQLAAAQREEWSRRIKELALTWGVGFASHAEIDNFGIVYAVRLAVHRALKELSVSPEHLLLDYIFLPDNSLPQTALIKGDARSLSIASASILAKTARDACLCKLADRYSGYGLARHKGYSTLDHLKALARLGPSPVHRRTYGPIREFYQSRQKGENVL